MHDSSQARLLRTLLSALGVGVAGCGGNVVVDTGGTTSTTSGTTSGTTSTTTGSTTSTVTVTTTVNCLDFLAQLSEPPVEQTCAAGTGAYSVNVNCFKPPFGPGSCQGAFTDQCVLDTYSCGFIQGGYEISCGPIDDPSGLCCYTIAGDCAVGRPFVVAGTARLGTLVSGDGAGWCKRLAPDLAALDAATRAALADAWGREALFEHASIASFARFAMQLLALGAPAELVSEAQRALADEQEHARGALGLAAAYTGRSLGFGPLPIEGGLDGCSDAAAIAASLASEGCVAETIAALQAAAARDEARDPVVKAELTRVADDEAAHAALAWKALAWMLDAGGDGVRAAVEKVFAEAEAHVSIGAVTDLAGDAAALRAHGYLPVEERRSLAREALGRVVGPAALALMNGARQKRVSPSSRAAARPS